MADALDSQACGGHRGAFRTVGRCAVGPRTCACVCGRGPLVALSGEVLPDCDNRLSELYFGADAERAIRTCRPTLTAEAGAVLATLPTGASARNVAALLRSGRLVLVDARPVLPRQMMRTPAPERAAGPNQQFPDESPRLTRKTSWIRFLIVDDVSGIPVPGIQLEVRHPGGRLGEYVTGADGRVTIDPLEPGLCDVSSPLAGARLNDTADFVALGSQPSGGGSRRTPNIGAGADARRIAEVFEHKVRTGETLKSLAEANGLTWQQLARFNWDTDVPDQINYYLGEYVGCTRKRDGRNYSFDDADDPGIVHIPRHWSAAGLATEQEHVIRVNPAFALVWLDIQTVDEFDVRVPNTTLILQRLDGAGDVRLTTDATGYFHLERVLAGHYRVLLDDGTPAMYSRKRFGADGDAAGRSPELDDFEGDLEEAILDTALVRSSITSVVVRHGAAQERRQRRELRELYHRPNPRDRRVEPTGEPLDGRGPEAPEVPIRQYIYAVDNLAIAAGWDADGVRVSELLKHLRDFLTLHYPSALPEHRGFYLVLVDTDRAGARLRLVAPSGAVEFQAPLLIDVVAPVGAYATFQLTRRRMYLDLAYRDIMPTPERAPDGADPAKDAFSLADLMSPADGERFRSLARARRRAHAILYNSAPSGWITTPPPGEDFYTVRRAPNGSDRAVQEHVARRDLTVLALKGATGKLENYAGDEVLDETIHARNVAVVKHVGWVWRGYIDAYVRDVRLCRTEDELHALGPPRSIYEFATPVNATDARRRELWDLRRHAKLGYSLKAWEAINEKLNEIYGLPDEGEFFFNFSIAAEGELGPVRFEIKRNFDVDVDGRILKSDATITTSGEIPEQIGRHTIPAGGSGAADFSLITGESSEKLNARFGRFGIEASSDGTISVSGPFGAGASANPQLRQFGAGLSHDVEIGDFKFKLNVGVTFQSLRDDTVLKYVSHAPGFFERRTLNQLLKRAQWNDLRYDEQYRLSVLGWDMDTWDRRHRLPLDQYPRSARTSPRKLTSEERIAMVHLGLISDLWLAAWQSIAAAAPDA